MFKFITLFLCADMPKHKRIKNLLKSVVGSYNVANHVNIDDVVKPLVEYSAKSLYIFSLIFSNFSSQVSESIFPKQKPNVSNFIIGSKIAPNASTMLYSSQYF